MTNDQRPTTLLGRYRLVVLDIDGTLLDPAGQLAEPTRRAVRRLVETGVPVVLASGRTFRQAAPFALELGLAGPLVVVGGAVIRHLVSSEIWRAEHFSRATAEELVSRLRERGLNVVVTLHQHARAEYLVLRGQPADAMDEARLRRHPEIFHFVEGEPSVAELELTATLRVSVSAPPTWLEDVRSELRTELGQRCRWHTIRAPDLRYPLMEIYPPGVDKGSALTALCARLGVAMSEVVAVGDDANDVPMVAAAGLGVAMGNAIAELRAVARRVIAPNSEHGLARFLEELTE